MFCTNVLRQGFFSSSCNVTGLIFTPYGEREREREREREKTLWHRSSRMFVSSPLPLLRSKVSLASNTLVGRSNERRRVEGGRGVWISNVIRIIIVLIGECLIQSPCRDNEVCNSLYGTFSSLKAYTSLMLPSH